MTKVFELSSSYTCCIAVLMTCHNRRDKTLACLKSLYSQALPPAVTFSTYLVDDGCTDGTSEAINQSFPQINLLHGDGSLYWCGGMRLAWDEAIEGNYDYYLWLNDDVVLFNTALGDLLRTSQQILGGQGKLGIIIGSCRDPYDGKHSYGGAIRKMSNAPVIPCGQPQSCDMMNGNIVLIPHEIVNLVGNLSPEFIHSSADNDYGLRAIKAGFRLWIASGYQGLCPRNNSISWADPGISLRRRWRLLQSPKGQPPYETYVFARRHSGIFWMADIVKLYLCLLFPGIYNKLKQKVKS